MIPVYEKEMSAFFSDPWVIRDAYIRVVCDRSDDNIESFFHGHVRRDISVDEKNKMLDLLEMQRHAMLMYTSCGWFFDDIAGIEAIQILRYAARAIQLAKETGGVDLESCFVEKLESAASAASNIAVNKNGAEIYRKFVKIGKCASQERKAAC